MPWIVWVLVGAVSLRAGLGLLMLWDRRALSARSGAAPAAGRSPTAAR